jgi:hypothetical protein
MNRVSPAALANGYAGIAGLLKPFTHRLSSGVRIGKDFDRAHRGAGLLLLELSEPSNGEPFIRLNECLAGRRNLPAAVGTA